MILYVFFGNLLLHWGSSKDFFDYLDFCWTNSKKLILNQTGSLEINNDSAKMRNEKFSISIRNIAWIVSKYEAFSELCFPVFKLNTEIYFVNLSRFTFSQNTGKYGPEKTPYLDTFHGVKTLVKSSILNSTWRIFTWWIIGRRNTTEYIIPVC